MVRRGAIKCSFPHSIALFAASLGGNTMIAFSMNARADEGWSNLCFRSLQGGRRLIRWGKPVRLAAGHHDWPLCRQQTGHVG
jgi:hypothetical protein